MEQVQDIVIVGAGIAGLATSLGLHRLGIQSIVLESADSLRVTGFALGMWTNAWRAIDALGLGDVLRAKHSRLTGIVAASVDSGDTTTELPFTAIDSQGDLELRCMNRKVLLETLADELPPGTIRFSSKVVLIQTTGSYKSIHLADGTILKTKVLIGCDGVNSTVAKFLGFSKPSFTRRMAARGMIHFKNGHGFEPKFLQFFGKGFRYGVIPSNDDSVFWFFAFSPSAQEKEIAEDPAKMKQFILSKLGKVPEKIREVFENTEISNIVCSPLRFRHPWELIFGNISKDNVCVAGDALHPMTPDLGQGGCAALEDSIVLARVLAKALKEKSSSSRIGEKGNKNKDDDDDDGGVRIRKALENYAKERKWRGFDLISTAYMVGVMQQNGGMVLNLLRDKMAKFLAGLLLNKARFDCGNLTSS